MTKTQVVLCGNCRSCKKYKGVILKGINKCKTTKHFKNQHPNLPWMEKLILQWSQCMNRRVASIDALREEVRQWREQHNDEAVRINWAFTVKEACGNRSTGTKP